MNETIQAKEKQLPIITKPESFIIQNYPIKQINESEEGININFIKKKVVKVLSVSERKSVSDLIDKIANIIKEKRRLNQWRNYHPIKRDEIKDSKQKTLLKSRKRGNQQKMEKDDNETQSRNNKETKIQNEKKDIIQIQSQMLNILSKAKYSPVIINQESFKIIDDKNISKQSNFVSQSQFEILSNKKEYNLLNKLSIQEQ